MDLAQTKKDWLKIDAKFIALFVAVLVSFASCLIFHLFFVASFKPLYAYQPIQGSHMLKEPVKEQKTIVAERSRIYFMDTSLVDQQDFKFTLSSACAVESTAKQNPGSYIHFLVFGKSGFDRKDDLTSIVSRLPNVILEAMPVLDFVRNSSLIPVVEELMQEIKNGTSTREQKYELSRYLGDVLRFYLLLVRGGIYLDQDIISLNALKGFRNAVGCQQHFWEFPPALKCRRVNSGVVAMDANHRVARTIVDYYSFAEVNKRRPRNGNSVLNDALRHCRYFKLFLGLLSLKNNSDSITEPRVSGNVVYSSACLKILGIQILDPLAFYPIEPHEIKMYFDPSLAEDALHYISRGETALIHYYHSWAQKYYNSSADVLMGSAFAKLAERNCPRTFTTVFSLRKKNN